MANHIHLNIIHFILFLTYSFFIIHFSQILNHIFNHYYLIYFFMHNLIMLVFMDLDFHLLNIFYFFLQIYNILNQMILLFYLIFILMVQDHKMIIQYWLYLIHIFSIILVNTIIIQVHHEIQSNQLVKMVHYLLFYVLQVEIMMFNLIILVFLLILLLNVSFLLIILLLYHMITQDDFQLKIL